MKEWIGWVDLHNGKFPRRYDVRVRASGPHIAAARAVKEARESAARSQITQRVRRVSLHLIRVE